eukprot:m.402352 g.402352  ORF g.402352 m.402352 type:complete len:355 (-) comp21177_c0_seq10:874-1938(-)
MQLAMLRKIPGRAQLRFRYSWHRSGPTHAQSTRYAKRSSSSFSDSPPRFVSPRRVVVTGIGIVSPLGVGVDVCWKRLNSGSSGLVHLTGDGFQSLPSRVAGLVPRARDNPDSDSDSLGSFDPLQWLDAHSVRTLPDGIQFGIAAAEQALVDAGLDDPGERSVLDRNRMGVAIGCGISGAQDLLRGNEILQQRGHRRVSPYLVPNALVNMTAGLVSIRNNLRGPNHAVSTACATGAHAIGDAFRFISLGDADVMVCGSTDACVLPIVVSGFCRAQALTTRHNDGDPRAASRPFDDERSGFVIAEGGVIHHMDPYCQRPVHVRCGSVQVYNITDNPYTSELPSFCEKMFLRECNLC